MDLTIIDTLSLDDLQKAQRMIDKRIQELQTKEQIREILQVIERDGYYISIAHLGYDVPLQCIDLRYKVDVSTFDRDHEHDIHIAGPSDKQPPWVSLLKFKYDPKQDDEWDLPHENAWEYRDWDDPVIGHTSMPVYLYYKGRDVLPEKFRSINEDGDIETWEIREGKAYVDTHFVGDLGDIEIADVFVLPENKP